MAEHSVSEVTAKSSHRRGNSRTPSPGMRNKTHLGPSPNATGLPVSGASTLTKPETGPARDENSYSNAQGNNTGIIREGLGSLNRWSQSTASSRSPPNNPVGHRRGSSVSGYGGYGDSNSPEGVFASPIAINMLDQPSQTTITPIRPAQVQGNHTPQGSQTSGPTEPLTLGLQESSAIEAGQHDFANVSDGNAIPLHEDDTDETPPAVGENLSSSVIRENSGGKRYRSHSQKAMLSKALQKANTAVLLDNAANFEGAMDAYNEACQLLQLVMLRSNGGNGEKIKLQEIRDTYMIRISELQGMDLSREPDTKALPERPVSDDGSCGDLPHSFAGGSSRFSGGSTSPPTSRSRHEPLILEEGGRLAPGQIPPRRQSLLPSPLDDELRFMTAPPSSKGFPDHGWYGLPSQASRSEHLQTARCDVDGILRPTLFPARPRSPEVSNMEPNSPHGPQYRKASLLSTAAGDASESTSWLDTIDESGPSSPTSAHSQASSLYLRHRKSSLGSQGTEAEFDAALDAAVEAAYDEGLEPAIELAGNESDDDDVVANARRNVELAKQKVREAEREAAEAMIRGRPGMIEHTNHVCPDYLDEESEEEERLLEEMTRGYVMDDFEFGLQSKSALPRQFGSSGVSGKTWENSTISNTETGGASLPTLVEDDALSTVGASLNSPTPLSADEILPSASMASPNVDIPPQQPLSRPAPGVRARRLSGQNPKDLKIQTNNHWRTDSEVSGPDQASSLFDSPLPPIPKDESQTSYKSTVPAPAMRHGVGKDTRNSSMGSLAEGSITDGGLRKVLTEESDYGNANTPSTVHPMGKVPSAPDNLGQRNVNQNALRARNVSVPTSDPTTVDSPHTPAGSAFPVLDFHKGPASGGIPIPPTPTATTFAPDGLLSGGLSLFDNHIHSPTNPGTPNPAATNAPNPLEPCPESFLLRPFWLMRCMYESIAHPSGAYLSTKLFIPRDMWCVKNVKLKAVEEKVSSCDLLTAALLKLAQVDTFDADAVLEEMQSLEVVLDQVQASLSKKLGNDVGVQGAMSLFKLFPSSDDAASASDAPPRVSNGPSKSYLTSWRKLRSKNSGTGATTPLSSSKEPSKDNLTINSLPMTSTPSSQSVKRNVMQLQLNGPNANYMGALARLCDAAQVLDQIAQQVEDPGLKHSSPTLVGLELSTRHAAEFFGFYVCRFILMDIAMMLDKFIKRGSEWVLA